MAASLRERRKAGREAAVAVALRKGEAGAARLAWAGARGLAACVTAESCCAFCRKRLAGSVVGLFPLPEAASDSTAGDREQQLEVGDAAAASGNVWAQGMLVHWACLQRSAGVGFARAAAV